MNKTTIWTVYGHKTPAEALAKALESGVSSALRIALVCSAAPHAPEAAQATARKILDRVDWSPLVREAMEEIIRNSPRPAEKKTVGAAAGSTPRQERLRRGFF